MVGPSCLLLIEVERLGPALRNKSRTRIYRRRCGVVIAALLLILVHQYLTDAQGRGPHYADVYAMYT